MSKEFTEKFTTAVVVFLFIGLLASFHPYNLYNQIIFFSGLMLCMCFIGAYLWYRSHKKAKREESSIANTLKWFPIFTIGLGIGSLMQFFIEQGSILAIIFPLLGILVARDYWRWYENFLSTMKDKELQPELPDKMEMRSLMIQSLRHEYDERLQQLQAGDLTKHNPDNQN